MMTSRGKRTKNLGKSFYGILLGFASTLLLTASIHSAASAEEAERGEDLIDRSAAGLPALDASDAVTGSGGVPNIEVPDSQQPSSSDSDIVPRNSDPLIEQDGSPSIE